MRTWRKTIVVQRNYIWIERAILYLRRICWILLKIIEILDLKWMFTVFSPISGRCWCKKNCPLHCEKYRNFTWFPGVKILRKSAVSAQFRVIRLKLCGNCAFPENLHTRKSGEIMLFFAVLIGGVRLLESFSISVLIWRIKHFSISMSCSWVA